VTVVAQPSRRGKESVKQHWEAETCGIRYGTTLDEDSSYFAQIRSARYRLEPYILGFQDAPSAAGKDVLEVGVGAGSDFIQWPNAGAKATGIDLTRAGVSTTRRHLIAEGHADSAGRVFVGDAEQLPFRDESFDIVYSFGVLHHSPDTLRALEEAHRVLRKGGTARIMIYHSPSWTALMLWVRYAFLAGRWAKTTRDVVFERLESPGTKVYTDSEAMEMMHSAGFVNVRMRAQLGPGDLLTIQPSARYRAAMYRVVWALYPRFIVRALGNRFGLGLMIEAERSH